VRTQEGKTRERDEAVLSELRGERSPAIMALKLYYQESEKKLIKFNLRTRQTSLKPGFVEGRAATIVLR
jgi:hypothetical protein